MALSGWVEHAVEILGSWVPRAVVLLSLAMHLILVLFSGIRRRECNGWLRLLLWLAYQLTDWAPTYVLGNLYLESNPREKQLVAFWLPFLLLHLARPDNISAYTMEDNVLAWRLIIFVPAQTAGAIYVWYRYIYVDCTAGMLLQASNIMFFLGIFKYWEGAFALRRADLGWIRWSLKQPPSRYGGNYRRDEMLRDDEKALLDAHDLFHVCKCAFSDYPVDATLATRAKSMFRGEWMIMCKVVEMELSLMYDILYTKAAVIHTWGGYLIRVLSPPLTGTALVLFILHCKEHQKIEEIYITYILLGATLFLDVRWLLRALVSTWTYSFFRARPECVFYHEVLCWRRWQQLRRFLDYLSRWLSFRKCANEPKSYRLWSGTFGQHNLLYECTGDRHSLYSSLLKKIESTDHLPGLEIPDLVKKKLFKSICRKLFRAPAPEEEEGVILLEKDQKILFPAPEEKKKKKPYTTGSHGTPGRAADTCQGELPCVCGSGVPIGFYCGQGELPWACGSGGPIGFHYGQPFHMDVRVDPDWYDQAGRPDPNEQEDHCSPGHPDQAASPDPNEQYNYERHTKLGEDMRFAPELQEAILIWHIAVDIFLLCSSNTGATELSKYVKAITAMSDYMAFLVAERPNMLPGLKLRSLYEATYDALVEVKIWSKDVNVPPNMLPGLTLCNALKTIRCKKAPRTNEEEQLALWMLLNKDRLKGSKSTVLWEGTQYAGALIGLLKDEQYRGETTKEFADTMKRLVHWIPELEGRPQMSPKKLLKFILDAWVRLLIYASIRCSREAHAMQLSRGGELTTVIWIITEHADINDVKKNCPSFFI